MKKIYRHLYASSFLIKYLLVLSEWCLQYHLRWASLIQKLDPLIVGPLLYSLVSLTAGPLT